MARPLTEAEKNAAKFPANKTIAEQILTNAQDSRPVVQDFVPLAESMEWELGQQYFRERGNKVFISDSSPVPFVINNDGNLSRNAAEVFFTSLIEAGTVTPSIGATFPLDQVPQALRYLEAGQARGKVVITI